MQLPVTRADGELIGFLMEADGLWTPTTVFGYPLGDGSDEDAAEEFLHGVGLSVLAEKWLAAHEDAWIAAEILEASPTQVTVQYADIWDDATYGKRRTFAAPVGDQLRLARP